MEHRIADVENERDVAVAESRSANITIAQQQCESQVRCKAREIEPRGHWEGEPQAQTQALCGHVLALVLMYLALLVTCGTALPPVISDAVLKAPGMQTRCF